jgi:hypothetical protein
MSTSVSVWGLLANATSDQLCHLPATCSEGASASTSVEDVSADLILGVEASGQLAPEAAGLQPASRPVADLRPHRWAGTLPGSMAGKRPPAVPTTPISLGC